MKGDFWIPYAIDVDGSLIQVFDPVNHERLPEPELGLGLDTKRSHDRRWVPCKRPAVMVGGELLLEHLELTYNPNRRLLPRARPAAGQWRRAHHRRLRPPAGARRTRC